MKKLSQIFTCLPSQANRIILSLCIGYMALLGMGVSITSAFGQDVLWGLTSKSGPEGSGTMFSINTTDNNLTVHKAFESAPSTPYGSLIRGSDGSLYGMSLRGGWYGYGVIFRLSEDGTGFTVLKSFNSSTDGASPNGSLVQGSDGSFYGVAPAGGTMEGGTIFKLSADGTVFTVLKNFSHTEWDAPGPPNRPIGSLIQGRDGNLYGMTSSGGQYAGGAIFKMAADGTGFTVLKSFNPPTDGASPSGSLVQAGNGQLFGVTRRGGAFENGTIFSLSVDGTEFTTLKSFNRSLDGGAPNGGLIQGHDGDFYGMASSGGHYGNGTIFKISADGAGFTVLKSLAYSTDGANPQGSLLQGSDGLLYGMTRFGGADQGGTVFKLAADGTGFTVFKSFIYSEASAFPSYPATPLGGLLQGSDGSLYGMTSDGGEYGSGAGAIFRLATDGGGFTVLKSFVAEDGASPYSSLVRGSDGGWYGTTRVGGKHGGGIVFRTDADGTGFTVLKSFESPTGDSPFGPEGNLIEARDGKFYGVTTYGGQFRRGAIFSIAADGTDFTVVKSFSRFGEDGANPRGGLIQGRDGDFYGMAQNGGQYGGGTIFRLSEDGLTFTVLKSFDRSTEGAFPAGNLLQGRDGYLYGTTSSGADDRSGSVFRILPDGTGFTELKRFNRSTDGASPTSSLIQGRDNNFYGVAINGGQFGSGTIFKLTADGSGFTVLKSFNASADGGSPAGALVQGRDGSFYGMASAGGAHGEGTIFRLSEDGTAYTVLRSLNRYTDGASPLGSLVIANDNICLTPELTEPALGQSSITQVNSVVSASATVAGGSLQSATWNWGDGTTSIGIVNNTTITGSHTYLTPGVYAVTLTVTNNCGENASSIYEYAVVYDPEGGFITGEGWINSPAGAYHADPSAIGKANFGFVSKYQKGATVPTGKTEFKFKVVSLDFKSTAYEWLVVAGSKAQYKGEGTLNGEAGYGFMLSAIDGQVSGGGGVDKFRIKIWDKTKGSIVYDNQPGEADDATATTALGGGAITIVVKRGKKGKAIAGDEVRPELFTEVAAYPNPVSGSLTLHLGDLPAKVVQIRLTDMLGKSVEHNVHIVAGESFFEIDMSELKAGIYMVYVNSGTSNKVLKVIKQ
jgi:uncharacterized repeat protein (TIGR03803 family)